MQVVGSILIMIGLPTALLDLGMNKPYARWAPWGFGIAVIGLILIG
jgi:hypothetical protein